MYLYLFYNNANPRNMFRSIRFILITALLILIYLILYKGLSAQSSLNYQWYLNANVGFSQLYGDVQNENNPITKLSDETGIGYGARLGKYISPVFAAHLQFYRGMFQGNKDKEDLKFESDLLEYQIGATINLTNLFFENKERRINIYGTAGFSTLFFRSEARRQSTGNLVNDYGYTTGNNRQNASRESAVAFPIGAGLDIKLSERLFLNLESVMRLTNSDKLDGVESGSRKDAYYYTLMGLSYNFARKKTKGIQTIPMPGPETAATDLGNERVNLVYVIPENLKSMDEFTMKCIIHKGKIDGKGEISQILPIGFNVLDTVIGNAKTDFSNYILHLSWDEMPKDSVFEISYRIKLDKIFGKFPLNTIMFFSKTNKDYRFKTEVSIQRTELPEIVVTEPKPEVKEEEPKPAKNKVEFSVQVRAAYNAVIPIQLLASKYGIRDEIKEEQIGNWHKYSVGNFETFKEAKDYRNNIMNGNGIRDAFIVAYLNGQRLNSLSDLKDVAPEAFPFKSSYQENGTVYRVQILALLHSKVSPETLQEIYKIDLPINEETSANWNKYTIGNFTSISQANMLRAKMVEKGITDAFIVIYKNGERVIFSGHL